MANLLKFIINPLLKSQIRLYVFLGLLVGLYQLFLFIKYQELKIFGLGLLKGTIIGTGIGIGVVIGLALKEMCKMKKLNDQKDKTEYKNEIS